MAGCNGCEARLAGLRNIELLPAFSAEAPACSVDGRERGARAAAFRAVFAWLLASEREGAGFRWIFQGGPGVERRVRELARQEHACCPFLSFAVSTRDAEVVWEVRAMEGAETLADAFFALPDSAQQDAGFDAPTVRALFTRH